jgi:hypothetical protein
VKNISAKQPQAQYEMGRASRAPKGNWNALKHRRYTREAIEQTRQLRALLRQAKTFAQKID